MSGEQRCIIVEGAGKKFSRSVAIGFLLGLSDRIRNLLNLPPRAGTHPSEFWALRDISFELVRGTCLAVIGPNGAGKSTLIKLIDRTYRPSLGRVATVGSIRTISRSDTGLQASLTGRENVQFYCGNLGLKQREIPALLAQVMDFADLGVAMEKPVKSYSDGMYARLQFALATCVTPEILLVDEVLAVGDLAFQIRSLERLNQLKQQGTSIVFISHSEMNVRCVADKCLLLFEGRQLAWGEVEALFHQYYLSIGVMNERLKPYSAIEVARPDRAGSLRIGKLVCREGAESVVAGDSVKCALMIESDGDVSDVYIHLNVCTPAGLVVGAAVSTSENVLFSLKKGGSTIGITLATGSLAPGIYRLSAGISKAGEMIAYRRNLLDLHIKQRTDMPSYGLVTLHADFELTGK